MKQLFVLRRNFLIVNFLVLIILSFFIFGFNNRGSMSLLLFISVWNLFIYTYLFIKELNYYPTFHPFILLYIVLIQQLGFSNLYLFNRVFDGESIYFGIYDCTNILTMGAWAVSFQASLILLGYFRYERKVFKRRRVLIWNIPANNKYYFYAFRFYIVVWIFRLLEIYLNVSSLSNVFYSIVTCYQISEYFLVFDLLNNRTKSRARSKFLLMIIVVIEVLMALNSGMKESIIMPIVPVGIFYCLKSKLYNVSILSYKYIVPISLLIIFSIGFVFPYISIYRSSQNMNVKNALNEYSNYFASNNSEEKKDLSINYFLSRSSTTVPNAWAIDYHQKNGLTPELFLYTLQSLVPRIIWFDKPNMIQGRYVYNLVTGNRLFDMPRSSASFSLSFLGFSIVSLGWLFGLLACYVIGYMVAYFWYKLRDYIPYNPIAIYAFTYYIVNLAIMKNFDSIDNGGVNYIVLLMFFLFLIRVTNNNLKIRTLK